jgi:uncharacterized membrane protein
MPGFAARVRTLPRRVRPLGEFSRTFAALLVAFAAEFVLLRENASMEVSAAVYWSSWAFTYLALTWVLILRSSPEQTRGWALEQRVERRSCLSRVLMLALLVGRTGSLLFIVAVSLTGLGAALNLLPQLRDPSTPEGLAVAALNGVGVVLAWAVLHTAFALYYARRYYGDARVPGGLRFPGEEEPNLLDFAYLSFTLGLQLGTTDVEVAHTSYRRTVLLHVLLSFAYNTVLIALVVNYVIAS